LALQNDFLPFATGGGANVLTQSQYAALNAIATGYQSGVAQSAALNKTWRQSSIMAAVLAQLINNNAGQPAVDDGTTATLLANLTTAISVIARQNPVLTDTGTANAYVVSNAAALTAYPTVSGLTIDVAIANTNTGASTLNVDGLGTKPIVGLGLQPLQGNELPQKGVACLMYVVASNVNGGNGAWVVMECTGGTQQVAPATQSQHAMQLGQATGRLLNVQVLTSSGTYTPTSGTTSVVVEAVGGGGGSGGVPATSSTQSGISGPGAPGSYAKARYTSSFSGVTVTIGSGGTAGTTSTAGGAGGTTSFGALLTCPGGGGSPFGSASATTGNASSGSAASLPSGSGILVSTVIQPNGALQASANIAAGQYSPPSPMPGSLRGKGADGVFLGSSSAAVVGSAGTGGAVVVWEYA